ncbi:MAG: HPr family phosphocarrier protein [Anaerolineae bacterium]|nr:HPr family phosphocarrier protein [Anaerolineae bacterium]
MPEISITIQHKAGLHLRPAAMFVRTACRFVTNILVRNDTRGGDYKNAKSTLSVMQLGVNQGHSITVRADGPDAEAALEAIRHLTDSNFEDTGADMPA